MPNRHSKKQVEISLKPVVVESQRENSALRFREKLPDTQALEPRVARERELAKNQTHSATKTDKT